MHNNTNGAHSVVPELLIFCDIISIIRFTLNNENCAAIESGHFVLHEESDVDQMPGTGDNESLIKGLLFPFRSEREREKKMNSQ